MLTATLLALTLAAETTAAQPNAGPEAASAPAADALGAPEATAAVINGTLTVDDRSIPLTHGFAFAEKSAFDETKDDIVVVLTDVALSPGLRWDTFAREASSTFSRLYGVEVRIAQDGSALSGHIYAGGQARMSISRLHEFKGLPPDGTHIAGKLSSNKPYEIGPVRCSYEVTFDLPVRPRKPYPAAKQAAIAASAQGEHVTAYLAAIRAGDAAKLRTLVIPEIAKDLEGAKAKELMAILQAAPRNSPAFTDIIVEGDTTTIELTDKVDTSTYGAWITLVKSDNGWLVAGAPGLHPHPLQR